MKKNIMLFSVAVLCLGLTAFNFINCKDFNSNYLDEYHSPTIISGNQEADTILKKKYSDFSYGMGPRFHPITKEEIMKKISIHDFLTEKRIKEIVSYKSIKIIVIKDEGQSNIRARGIKEEFTENQLKILQSAKLSSHFTVRADFMALNEETGEIEDSFIGPHFTVVPQKQAVYVPGKEKFLEYIQLNNKENTANINEDKLRPAVIFFTITKKGKIGSIRVGGTSGFADLDDAMIKLVRKTPGKWISAENSKGEKVEQELAVRFGVGGC